MNVDGHSSPSQYSPPKGWKRSDVLLASVCINLLTLALPFVILQVYDRIIPGAAFGTLSFLMAGLATAIVMDMVLRIARSAVLSAHGSRYEHRASVAAFDTLLQTDVNAFETQTPSGYVDDFKAIAKLREFYAGQPAILIADLPFAVIFLGLIFVIGGPLALVPVTVLAVLLVSTVLLSTQLRETLQSHKQADKRRYDFLIELFDGIHSIKSLAMEKTMTRRYERLQSQSARSVFHLGRLHNLILSVSYLFAQTAVVATVTVGAYLAVHSNLTMGGLAACTMLTGRALQPILRGLSFWTGVQGLRLAHEETERLFGLPKEDSFTGQATDLLTGRITFSHVYSRFNEHGPHTFNDLTFDIRPGEIIGITGDNGCGMTTLLNIMMGFHRPSEGHVYIDGTPIEHFDPSVLRKQIGYMPHAGTLFQGTILENVAMFREGEAQKRAVEVIRFLGLTDFITSLPAGLDTKLSGTNADKIPSGFRQRLVLARALVNAPAIVLFDNANSGLDAASDTQLIEALQKMKRSRTIVLACHRPSYLKLCDRVFTITDGVLSETFNRSQEHSSQEIDILAPDRAGTQEIAI